MSEENEIDVHANTIPEQINIKTTKEEPPLDQTVPMKPKEDSHFAHPKTDPTPPAHTKKRLSLEDKVEEHEKEIKFLRDKIKILTERITKLEEKNG